MSSGKRVQCTLGLQGLSYAQCQPLTRTQLVKELHTALAKAGIDATKFAGHSFRIGAATIAASCGMPDSLIQTRVETGLGHPGHILSGSSGSDPNSILDHMH